MTRLILAFLLCGSALSACRQADNPESSGTPQEPSTTALEPAAAAPETTAATGGTQLEGMFRYLADAARFRDCRTNRSYPVAMEGAYLEVETAYLNSGIEPGQEVYVKIAGRFLERPAMQSNNNEISLIVDVFENLDLDKSCAHTELSELLNTYWKLTELNGNPVATAEGAKEAHLILSEPDARAHGNAGCNNYFGRFQLDDDKLAFGALGSTMMACAEGMDTERAFLDALGQTTRYVIEGETLQLYAEDQLLAQFEAVYL
jgi:copper homeostasis protein (lipoprotein)